MAHGEATSPKGKKKGLVSTKEEANPYLYDRCVTSGEVAQSIEIPAHLRGIQAVQSIGIPARYAPVTRLQWVFVKRIEHGGKIAFAGIGQQGDHALAFIFRAERHTCSRKSSRTRRDTHKQAFGFS